MVGRDQSLLAAARACRRSLATRGTISQRKPAMVRVPLVLSSETRDPNRQDDDNGEFRVVALTRKSGSRLEKAPFRLQLHFLHVSCRLTRPLLAEPQSAVALWI